MIKPDQIAASPGQVISTTLDRPLDHLTACHRRIEDRLRTMERAAEHIDDKRREALAALSGAFHFMDSNGAIHTEDEEESVFPRLEGKLTGEERDFIAELEKQHDRAEGLYAEIKEQAEGLKDATGPAGAAFAESVARLCELYRAHIAIEDRRLIEIGNRVLNAEDLAGISNEMKTRRGRTN